MATKGPKRAFDLVAAALMLVATSPVLLLAMLAIRASSPGPALFSQIRVGQNGTLFRCHKLRTMYLGTPSLPSHEAPANSVTAVGKMLRRFKIDELPQLWNVLNGEMSLVGPARACRRRRKLIERRKQLGCCRRFPASPGLPRSGASTCPIRSSAPRQMPPTSRLLRSASTSKSCLAHSTGPDLGLFSREFGQPLERVGLRRPAFGYQQGRIANLRRCHRVPCLAFAQQGRGRPHRAGGHGKQAQRPPKALPEGSDDCRDRDGRDIAGNIDGTKRLRTGQQMQNRPCRCLG